MKKILFILAIVVGTVVHADYLYWMVNPNPSTIKNYVGGDLNLSVWDNAKLYVGGSPKEGGTVVDTITKSEAGIYSSLDAYAVADIGNNVNTSFYVELYQASTCLAVSWVHDSLANYIFADNSMAANAGTGYTVTSFVVPEPTSGLLFLVGGMLLGLRRRRMV